MTLSDYAFARRYALERSELCEPQDDESVALGIADRILENYPVSEDDGAPSDGPRHIACHEALVTLMTGGALGAGGEDPEGRNVDLDD